MYRSSEDHLVAVQVQSYCGAVVIAAIAHWYVSYNFPASPVARSRCILPRPLSRLPVVLVSVVQVLRRDVVHERILRVGVGQQTHL